MEITGTVSHLQSGKCSKYQPIEIQANKVRTISASDSDFSARCPEDAGPDTRITQRHLFLRTEKFSAKTVLRDLFLRALRQYFHTSGCTEITPPSFVRNQCERGATLFKVDHVGQPAYLTQSFQLLKYIIFKDDIL